jgi:hypothetical protein
MAHAKKQRRKENREPVFVILGAERWVSMSVGFDVGGFRGAVVNRADARGGVWDVEVVEEIIGRPLHHTLPIVESQQAVSIVVQCPAYRLKPKTYRLKPKTVGSPPGVYGDESDGDLVCLRNSRR